MRKSEKKELALFKQIQYLRMISELEFINKLMEEKAPHKLEEESNFFKRTVKGAENILYRDAKTKELLEEKEQLEGTIAEFGKKNPEVVERAYNFAELREMIDSHFDDKESFEIGRDVLAISVVLDNEYTYPEREHGLMRISNLLYGDDEALCDMEKELSSIYSRIARRSMSPFQTNLIVGAGAVTTALLLASIPFIAFGGIAANVGVGATLLYACLVGGGVSGAVYAGLRARNKAEAKRAFREMDFDEAARLLTIRCLLVKRSKDELALLELKEQLSDLLAMTDDLRADVSYELFVEKENVELNRDKLKLFHNFDNEMMAIMSC